MLPGQKTTGWIGSRSVTLYSIPLFWSRRTAATTSSCTLQAPRSFKTWCVPLRRRPHTNSRLLSSFPERQQQPFSGTQWRTQYYASHNFEWTLQRSERHMHTCRVATIPNGCRRDSNVSTLYYRTTIYIDYQWSTSAVQVNKGMVSGG